MRYRSRVGLGEGGTVLFGQDGEVISKEIALPAPEIVRDPLTADILPSSVCVDPKGVIFQNGQKWYPIYCASCGISGGMVPEPSKDFAFYLCDEDRNNCSSKWSPLVDHMIVPQERFWEVARQEQLEKLGRQMTANEIIEAMRDPNHWLWKLARSEGEFIKQKRG